MKTMAIGDKINYGGINYTIIGSNEAQVGYGYTAEPYTSAVPRDYSGQSVVIPSLFTVDDVTYTVTIISCSSFYKCKYIVSIEIPFTIKTLGWSAFGAMESLETIIIPENSRLTSIHLHVIHLCDKLKNFFIPKSVKTLEAGVLDHTKTTIWYCGDRKFDVNVCNFCYIAAVHVPIHYKYNTFGNLPAAKDFPYPLRCATKRINEACASMNLLLIVYFIA